jgi:hypothetical protein
VRDEDGHVNVEGDVPQEPLPPGRAEVADDAPPVRRRRDGPIRVVFT